MSLLDEFAVGVQVQTLPQDTETGYEDELPFVDGDGKTHSSFLEKLQELNDMLSRVHERKHRRRRGFRLPVANRRPANKRADEVIDGGLLNS